MKHYRLSLSDKISNYRLSYQIKYFLHSSWKTRPIGLVFSVTVQKSIVLTSKWDCPSLVAHFYTRFTREKNSQLDSLRSPLLQHISHPLISQKTRPNVKFGSIACCIEPDLIKFLARDELYELGCHHCHLGHA